MTSIGWHVIRWHYSADDAKDPRTAEGRKWLVETKKGISDARFRKEFEIDYGALGGQLVFPEFDESIHVVDLFRLHLADWTTWLACDPHPRMAHGFLWLCVNRDGDMVVPWSYWPEQKDKTAPRRTIKQYAQDVQEVEKLSWKPPARFRVMDVAGRNFNATEETNYFDAYQAEGLFFQPAKRNRDLTGYDLISQALRPKPYGEDGGEKPSLLIMRNCGDNDVLIDRLKTIRFKEYKQAVADKNPPEEVEDKNRHLIDCLSYILLDEPRFIERHERQQDEGRYVVRATG
jgi:hypothetical protein